MASTMDSADEAGGEAVFTSDGLPSLVIPLPPPPLPSIGGSAVASSVGNVVDDGGGGDAVISEESDPRVAFEAFSDVVGSGWGGLSSTNNNATATATSSSSGIATSWQDPRRRLFQLKSEIDHLEATLANEKEQGGGGGGKEEDEENENLHAMTLELKSRLAAMGMDGDASSLATMLRGRQEDLSAVIARDMERLGSSSENLAEGMDNLSLAKGEESKEGQENGKDGKIVYELYRANAAAASSSCTIPREALLEQRLRKLELAMGTTTPSVEENTKSIMERLTEAERLSKETDPKQIEKLAAKAKVIRADLEAAARARTKLASKSSSSSSNNNSTNAAGNKEDAQMIAALHTQLIELEGLSTHLPLLTVRLLELANLHTNAAEFSTRLEAAEIAVARSEGVLYSVEEALNNVEGGWKVNMEGVERNVKRLDELLVEAEKLAKSSLYEV